MKSLAAHKSKVKIGFFGHSHNDIVYCFANEQLESLKERELILDPDAYYMINPGSVGQPRDGDPRLSYLTYDDESGKIRFFRLDYDINRCIRKAAIAGIWRPRWFRRSISLLNRIQNRLRRMIFE
jgi:predicted phosphodiesterase